MLPLASLKRPSLLTKNYDIIQQAIGGFMDPEACNYDSDAKEEDGSYGVVDNCETCDNDFSNDCLQDCN